MKSKATMPVPYLVALILAVVVIGILVYWFVLQQGRTVSVIDESECKARALAYCLETGFSKPKWEERSKIVCGNKYLETGPTADQCKDIVPKK